MRILKLIMALAMAFTLLHCPQSADEGGAFLEGYLTGNMTAPEGEATEENVFTYGGTSSPGDLISWTVDRDNNTFFMQNMDSINGGWIYGSVQSFPTGFLKFTVSSSSFGDVPTNSQAYALEVPGLVLFVHPINTDPGGTDTTSTDAPHLMALAAVGNSCDTFPGEYNVAMVGYYPGIPEADVMYADLTVSEPAVNSYALSLTPYQVSTQVAGTSDSGSLNCMGGSMFDVDPASNFFGFISGSGALVIDLGSGQGGLIGFKAGDISAAAANKTYTGIFSSYDEINGDEVAPVQASCNGFVCQGVPMNNVETGEVDTIEAASVDLSGGFTNGLATGTVTDTSAGTFNVIATAYETGSKTVIYLTGWDPSKGTSGAPFGVFLVSQ